MAAPGYDRKRLITILVVGGVLVAALGLYALTKGGGGGGSAASTTTSRASAGGVTSSPRRTTSSSGSTRPGATTTSTSTTTTTVATMPDSFETFTERNPFQPSVEAAGDGTGTGTTTPTTTSGAGTTPTSTGGTGTGGTGTGGTGTGGTGTGGTGTGGTGTGTGSQNPTGGTPVQLVEVIAASNSAVVQVGSTAYTVTPGQTFATSYKLVSLSGSCGQFLFGDSPFSLCTGEQVLK